MFAPGEGYSVLPAPHPRMMDDYLKERLEQALERTGWPRSREEWEVDRQVIRRALLRSLGFADGIPEDRGKVPVLQAGRRERDGYDVEHLALETKPGFYVTAHVYVPRDQQRRHPAVLCPHGHWDTAKASPHVQKRCANLARRGYVAMAVDMPGYGERRASGHRGTAYMWMARMTLAGVQFWDNLRAVDYLTGREDVDALRIGCTGASGGGNQTMILGALDERIGAVVPVCSVENFRTYFEKGFCECETCLDILAAGDQRHILALVAPRALLIVNGTLDAGFPIHRTRRTFDALRSVYEWYDAQKLELEEFYGPHEYGRPAREAAYRWFDRWLGKPKDADEEPTFIESPTSCEFSLLSDTYVTAASHRSVGDLYRDRAVEVLKTEALHVKGRPDELRQALLQRLSGRRGAAYPAGVPKVHETGYFVTGDGVRVDKRVLVPERGILLPLITCERPEADARRTLLVLTDEPNEVLVERRDLRRLIDGGWRVASLDPRGTGETASPEMATWTPARSLMLGMPVLGMQVWDVSAAVSHLRSEEARGGQVAVYGEGERSLTALISGCVDVRVDAVGVRDLVDSLAHAGGYALPRTAFVPGILECGDIGDLAALIAPRVLAIGRPITAGGDVLPPSGLESAFTGVRKAYGGKSAEYLHIGASSEGPLEHLRHFLPAKSPVKSKGEAV